MAKGAAELQGKWKLSAVETGEGAAELPDDLPVLEIKEGKVLYGREELATLTIDAGVTPKTIDLQFRDPMKTYEGVYSVAGDALKICVNHQTDGVKQRPTELTVKDHPTFQLLVFERAAPDDPPTLRGFVGMALKLHEENKEVVIASLVPDSPAKKADLQDGDVLLKVADVPATSLESTVAAVRKVKPGSELVIALRRDGKEKEITVKAGVFPFRFFGILD
jgi:uncharacterized protein (TIGR03067 family)